MIVVLATTVSQIEFEAVVLDEIILLDRKVQWTHLVHEDLTRFKKCFISSDTFSIRLIGTNPS
jgi:hypothetical protein